LCDKVFGYKGTLRHHEKLIHEKSLTMKCDECQKVFGEMRNLRRHVKQVHLRIKEFQCQICKKYYGQEINVHIRSVHGEKKK
jgi:uncharacterized C2H2 Zn-finger protein